MMHGMSFGDTTYNGYSCENCLRYHGHVNGSITSNNACMVKGNYIMNEVLILLTGFFLGIAMMMIIDSFTILRGNK